MKRILLTAILTAASLPAAAMMRKPRIDKSMETSGQHSKVDQPGHRVVETREQWEALWKELGRPAPQADLASHFAVAAFAGTRNTGGYKIVFDAPVEEKDSVLIRYWVVKPKGMMVTMSLTHPYAVQLFPKTDKKVVVEGGER